MNKKGISSQIFIWFGKLRTKYIPADFHHTLFLLSLAIVVLVFWFNIYPDWGNDYRIEFVGMTFDIVFILVIFTFFQFRNIREQNIERQNEIIQDYKRWDSEEAHFRIAGAVRRLNKLGVTKLNFAGIRLSNFEFAKHEISDISNSTFYDGSWGNPLARGDVLLRSVSFDWLQCSAVQFSPANPKIGLNLRGAGFARYIDCTFINADLTAAVFNGADMSWPKPPSDDNYVYQNDDENGNQVRFQVEFGAFDGAELREVSFQNATFKNADFRNTLNIEFADFRGARGLETCVFDDDATKNKIFMSANTENK